MSCQYWVFNGCTTYIFTSKKNKNLVHSVKNMRNPLSLLICGAESSKMSFYLPRPFNFLLLIMINHSWQLLCAQHKKSFFEKVMEGVATLSWPGRRPKLLASAERKLVPMVKNNPGSIKAQACLLEASFMVR